VLHLDHFTAENERSRQPKLPLVAVAIWNLAHPSITDVCLMYGSDDYCRRINNRSALKEMPIWLSFLHATWHAD
jgi:hypothetical protein